MFSDNKIAQDFVFSEDKLWYTVNYGLAPHFKGILQKDVESSECFVVSFDETFNPKTRVPAGLSYLIFQRKPWKSLNTLLAFPAYCSFYRK